MIPMNLKCSDDEFKDFILGTYIERYTAGRARAMRLINIAAVISEGKTKKHEVWLLLLLERGGGENGIAKLIIILLFFLCFVGVKTKMHNARQ